MKLLRSFLTFTLAICAILSSAPAQTTFTLNPLYSFGSRGDGSIQPGDSIGSNPSTGNDVDISAPGGYGIQPSDTTTAPFPPTASTCVA